MSEETGIGPEASGASIPNKMIGALLVGHGGFDKIEYHENIPVPMPCAGEVLIRVAAAGINNTDINTRIGWYSKGIKSGTEDAAASSFGTSRDLDASWSGSPLSFPRIAAAANKRSDRFRRARDQRRFDRAADRR